jgi:ubiquinone/menaquinone biosynthesis C-methylase UbiE
VPVAIERAKTKAKERGLSVPFQEANALELVRLGRQFDTVIDCGLFHTFSDEERPASVTGLAKVVWPGGPFHMLCLSDREPPGEGPRRVAQQEIHAACRDGWEVKEIREAKVEIASDPGAPQFSAGGPKAWLATIARKAE